MPDWTILERRQKQRALLRCNHCGNERDGIVWQANAGKLRCWNCSPDARPNSRRDGTIPALQAPRYVARTDDVAPIDGRIPTSVHGYARAVRYSLDPPDDPDAETQTGRIEIAGIRTKNPLNRRLHWTAVAGAAKAAQKATLEALYAALGSPPPDGHDYAYQVRISRLSTKGLQDDEGVVASMKAVRDAFAIFVRINDGNRRRFRASYSTGKAKVLSVVIEWTRTTGPFEDDGTESLIFFDEREELALRDEHRETRKYWLGRRRTSPAERDAADIKLAIGSLDEGGGDAEEGAG